MTQDSTPPLPPLEIPQGCDSDVEEVLRHWYTFRPSLYRELYQRGTLIQTVTEACEQTENAEYDLQMNLMKQGYESGAALLTAREIVREQYLFFPDETEVPDLAQTQAGLPFYQFQSPPHPDQLDQ